jgi:hypothetical protein
MPDSKAFVLLEEVELNFNVKEMRGC